VRDLVARRAASASNENAPLFLAVPIKRSTPAERLWFLFCSEHRGRITTAKPHFLQSARANFCGSVAAAGKNWNLTLVA
jgi:hypothetical protein